MRYGIVKVWDVIFLVIFVNKWVVKLKVFMFVDIYWDLRVKSLIMIEGEKMELNMIMFLNYERI